MPVIVAVAEIVAAYGYRALVVELAASMPSVVPPPRAWLKAMHVAYRKFYST